jgi:hypothetical protein
MSLEFNLEFPTENQVIVRFNGQKSDTVNFQSPITSENLKDIHWYLEIYAALYTTEIDDQRAQKIAQQLPLWGAKLLKSVLSEPKTINLFRQFKRQAQPGRLLTISASHPAILSLPWELLCIPKGPYLFHDKPQISIRRRLADSAENENRLKIQSKDRLHLFFVISRPKGAAFIDPRTAPRAVLDVLE